MLSKVLKLYLFFFSSCSLQTILGLPSLEEVLHSTQIIPQDVIYNMTNTSKHGVVVLQNKSGWIIFFCFIFKLPVIFSYS